MPKNPSSVDKILAKVGVAVFVAILVSSFFEGSPAGKAFSFLNIERAGLLIYFLIVIRLGLKALATNHHRSIGAEALAVARRLVIFGLLPATIGTASLLLYGHYVLHINY